MNIHGLNRGNRSAQTWTEPAGARFSWNRYIRNGPNTEPLLTLQIAHHLRLNPSSSNDVYEWAKSIIEMLNRVPSWMPMAQASVHPPPPRHYGYFDAQDIEAALTWVSIELPWLLVKVLMWRNRLMATYPLRSWMVAEEARHQVRNCHLNDWCYCQVSCSDRHRDPRSGWIICFSWCWKGEEEEEKCCTWLSWFKNAASDKYEKIEGVNKGNVNECIVIELKRCVKEKQLWYD